MIEARSLTKKYRQLTAVDGRPYATLDNPLLSAVANKRAGTFSLSNSPTWPWTGAS